MYRHQKTRISATIMLTILLNSFAAQTSFAINEYNYQSNNIYYQNPDACESQVSSASLSAANAGINNTIPNNSPNSSLASANQSNIEKALHYFTSKGLPLAAAAGFVGNMTQESQVDPTLIQGMKHADASYTPVNGVGFGLVQWTFTERQQPLINLAHATNRPMTDINLQLDYVWQELTTSYISTLSKLNNPSITPLEAAIIVHGKTNKTASDPRFANAPSPGYEASGDTAQAVIDNRGGPATDIYNYYKGKIADGTGLSIPTVGSSGSSTLSSTQGVTSASTCVCTTPSSAGVVGNITNSGTGAQATPSGPMVTAVSFYGGLYQNGQFIPNNGQQGGGGDDPGIGVQDIKLPGTVSFAELGANGVDGMALGNLPVHTHVRITYKGQSLVIEKLDVGGTEQGLDGHPRTVDLWWETARQLGFDGEKGVDLATIEIVDSSVPLTPFSGAGGNASAGASTANTTGCGSQANATPFSVGDTTFPIASSDIQATMKGGSDGNTATTDDTWCYTSTTNCHHDYNAIDFMAPEGTQIVTPKSGTIVSLTQSGNGATGGPRASITLKDDSSGLWYMTHGAPNSIDQSLKVGQHITAGTSLMKVGNQAAADNTPSHLHLDELPSAQYQTRPSCSSVSCGSYPFIDIQPQFKQLYDQIATQAKAM